MHRPATPLDEVVLSTHAPAQCCSFHGMSTLGVSLLGDLTNTETGEAFIRVAGYGLSRAQACSGLSPSLSQVASFSRGRMTGIRSWIDASSSLGVVVMIVHDATAVFVFAAHVLCCWVALD